MLRYSPLRMMARHCSMPQTMTLCWMMLMPKNYLALRYLKLPPTNCSKQVQQLAGLL